MTRALTLLWLLVASLGLVLVAEIVPAEDVVPLIEAAPPRLPKPRQAEEAAPVDDWMETVQARPLFNPARRPAESGDDHVSATTPLPRLTGVIVTPDGAQAIFAPQGGKRTILAEGDTLGRYQIKSIAPGAVTLSGAEGERVLRPSFDKSAEPARPEPARPRPASAAAPQPGHPPAPSRP